MSVKSKIVAAFGTAAVALVGGSALPTAPAHAGGRPVNVAFVHAWKKVYLHHGTVIVTASVRCKPGWQGGDLDMQVNQNGAYASGNTVVTLTCDNLWYPVRFKITDGYGTLHAGAVTISSQLLVTNVDSGDSAGAHDPNRAGTAIRGRPGPRG